MRDGRSPGKMVTNVCVKSNYDWLRINKALGTTRRRRKGWRRTLVVIIIIITIIINIITSAVFYLVFLLSSCRLYIIATFKLYLELGRQFIEPCGFSFSLPLFIIALYIFTSHFIATNKLMMMMMLLGDPFKHMYSFRTWRMILNIKQINNNKNNALFFESCNKDDDRDTDWPQWDARSVSQQQPETTARLSPPTQSSWYLSHINTCFNSHFLSQHSIT